MKQLMPKPNLRAVNKPDFVPCSHCDGAGKIELTGVHAETLAFLRWQSLSFNGAELARLCGVNPTAMNNRLVWLEKHGLVKSERYGSQKRWRAVNKER